MIPKKIQAIFEFIDFLDKNKKEYVEKYIPLCNELKKLDEQRNALKPTANYRDKQAYESIQKEIKEKFNPITENVYNPITSKLKELGIWSGDDIYTSIWNNNISEITDFKRNFSKRDTEQVFEYKKKYLSFRSETNSDFLSLSFVFSTLDEILKELFDFFKDTKENEFESFETKTIHIEDFTDLARNLKNNAEKNVKYSIPSEIFFGKKTISPATQIADIKNKFNVFNMGDKIEVGNITKNKGQITIGKSMKTEVNGNQEIAEKSFRWQKRETIISIIIGIIGIIIAYLSI